MTATRTFTLITVLTLGTIVTLSCSKTPMDPNRGLAFETGGGRGEIGGDETCGDLPTAPPSQRVDLFAPSFSDPTRVTNPLFPISRLDRVLLLGKSDGEPLRVETTLLPGTRRIRVNGREVETLTSQYVAWLGRRIHEVALDWYAQADDGSVWYFGEDVFNYADGVIEDTDGTWLAGRDGPVAMIMPANPSVGDVWRPENICGLVFEEVTGQATGVAVQGPRGTVTGALIVKELHMDGTFEDKTFAPGYGEFSTGSGANLEAVALAVPTDALSGPVPDELEALSEDAADVFRAAKRRNWGEASNEVEEMNDAWTALRARGVPPMIEAEMNEALASLEEAVEAREIQETRQASVDVALAALDLELRHRPRAEIDRALIEVWGRQLLVDAAANDRGAVRGDMASIRWIRERGSRGSSGDLDARIRELESAAEAGDLARAAKVAESLVNALGPTAVRP